MRGAVFLCLGRDSVLEISDDVDADGMSILAVDMCTDGAHGASLLDRAVLADEEVVADACPAIVQMPLMDSRSGDICVRVANVMNDDAVRDKAVFECAKGEICRLYRHARKGGGNVP